MDNENKWEIMVKNIFFFFKKKPWINKDEHEKAHMAIVLVTKLTIIKSFMSYKMLLLICNLPYEA